MRPAALTYSKGCVQRSSAITITVVDGLGAPAPWLVAAAALHRKEVAGMAASARRRSVGDGCAGEPEEHEQLGAGTAVRRRDVDGGQTSAGAVLALSAHCARDP